MYSNIRKEKDEKYLRFCLTRETIPSELLGNLKNMSRKHNFTKGDIINGHTFIEEVEPYCRNGHKKRRITVECQYCKTPFTSTLDRIYRGLTKSCGCYARELIIKRNTIEGLDTTSKAYKEYMAIKNRCYNRNNKKDYADYGGRGITMCDEWKYDSLAFCQYVEQLPNYDKKGYTINRINNDGNYEIGNIEFSDQHNQSANQRVRKTNRSGYRGVVKHGNKWQVQIDIHKTRHCLGSYSTALEGAIARDKYIIENELWEYPLQVLERPSLN